MSHYDLGNDFFRLWLDPTMLYSSALWDDATGDLEQAQRDKLARATALLDLRGGERVLEIGCGWGAIAAPSGAARRGKRHGPDALARAARIRARTRRRRRSRRRVSLRLEDYRDVEGEL